MITDCWDRDGHPLTVDEFAEHITDPIYRIVARDIWDTITVSTVWTGFAHGTDNQNRPLIFETMVFGGDWNGRQWHWATPQEAIVGHDRVAAEVLTALGHNHDQTSRKDQHNPDNLDPHRRRH